MEAAGEAGLAVHRLPIADGEVPSDLVEFGRVVAEIIGWAAAGESVVVHCKGGLGRAGTVGGCVLRAAGWTVKDSIAALRQARPGALETEHQELFVSEFVPSPPSMRSRVLGTVMGAAIGDAVGHPTEFLSMKEIHGRYGPNGVEGFTRWWERDGRRFAPYTDDTQLAEVVLRALVAGSQGVVGLDAVMGEIAAGVVAWSANPQGGHRAPGNACLAGAARLAKGVHWSEAGGERAGGCGSVMRAYPFGLLFASDIDEAERWAVEHSKMTHRDPIAFAACAAMAVGVGRTLAGETETGVFAAMIEAAGRHDDVTAAMIEAALTEALNGTSPEVTLDRLRGWAAHEAIAAAAYVAARHPRNPRATILEGANTPGDSDSIATLAGALVGARTGLEAMPVDWVRDVERADELLALAKSAAAVIDKRAG